MLTFSHIALTCKDPRSTEDFYGRHFGFKRARVIPLGDDNEIVFLKNGNMYLELFAAEEERTTAQPDGDGAHYPGVRHIAFQVDDVDSKIAEMGDEAVIKLGPLSFDDFIPGWRTVWVADPDGNTVEISQGYKDQESPPPPSA